MLAVALCRLAVDGATSKENVLSLNRRAEIVYWDICNNRWLGDRGSQSLVRHFNLREGAFRGRSVHIF